MPVHLAGVRLGLGMQGHGSCGIFQWERRDEAEGLGGHPMGGRHRGWRNWECGAPPRVFGGGGEGEA